MNTQFKMTYLAGGDEIFGPDFGGARVDTNVRAGLAETARIWASSCKPQFTLPMENEVMGLILNDGDQPGDAAMKWLKANPQAATPWLAGRDHGRWRRRRSADRRAGAL